MHLARAVVATGITALVMTPLGPAGADAGDGERPHRADDHPSISLPPVTEHAIDPVILAGLPPSPAAASATQVVQLTVVGGDLRLDHDADTVTLTPVGDGRTWSATLPPVRVVDARGTHEGWRVRWRALAVVADGERIGAAVRMDPAVPAVIHGIGGGLAAGQGRTLGRAERGWGGGTYDLGGTVTVRLPAGTDPSTVTVELEYAVA